MALNERPTGSVFHARLEYLPPSTNKMYIYTKRGPVPSKEMKQFKAKASIDIMKSIRLDSEELDSTKPYGLILNIYLPKLTNKGWPKTAKTRFARRDVTNLIKVLEDVVSRGLGIDDSCFIEVRAKKHDGAAAGFTGVTVAITELVDEY